MKMESKTLEQMLLSQGHEHEKANDDDLLNQGGGSNGNPQPQKPNKDWVKWAVIGFIAVVIALIITSVL